VVVVVDPCLVVNPKVKMEQTLEEEVVVLLLDQLDLSLQELIQ
jgi:hypothetical protein